jgi:hypothetical protein
VSRILLFKRRRIFILIKAENRKDGTYYKSKGFHINFQSKSFKGRDHRRAGCSWKNNITINPKLNSVRGCEMDSSGSEYGPVTGFCQMVLDLRIS